MITVVDYQAGNIYSVIKALGTCGVQCEVTSDPEAVRRGSGIVFPGVGAAGRTMEILAATGLRQVLAEELCAGKPYLGICLGMQILFAYSDEDKTPCLGVLPGVVKRLPGDLKVPHMGWNDVHLVREHPLLKGIKSRTDFYFAHSYYCEPSSSDLVIGEVEYGISLAGIVAKENLMGVQFHPEKSSKSGLRLIQNFCSLVEAYSVGVRGLADKGEEIGAKETDHSSYGC